MENTNKRLIQLELQFFAEGTGGEGGGNAGTATGAQGDGEGAAQAAQGRYRNMQGAGQGKDAKGDTLDKESAKGRLENKDAPSKERSRYKNIQQVKTQGEEAGKEGKAPTGESLDMEFESMIRGKYRDVWQKRTDAIFNRRFAEMKALKESHAAVAPLIDKLSERYKVQRGDIKGLLNALDSDGKVQAPVQSTHQQMDVGPKMEMGRLNSIGSRLKALNQARAQQREMQDQAQRQQRVETTKQRWMAETKAAKEVYPSLNFSKEYQNPDFTRLISAGIPVQHAYEIIHRDDILGGAMHYTAQKTREKLAADIAARGMRPAENGVTGQTAMIPGFHYDRLSKAAKAEIERRALKGERVNPRDYMDYH